MNFGRLKWSALCILMGLGAAMAVYVPLQLLVELGRLACRRAPTVPLS